MNSKRINVLRGLMISFVLGLAVWLAAPTPAVADSAIFGGGPFYAGGTPTMNALRASGYTTVVLWTLHVYADAGGSLIYNDQLVAANGAYAGNAAWPAQLATLKTAPTSVKRIEWSVGSWGASDFQAIKILMDTYGTNTDSIVYRNFLALKNATGADAIQFDDESQYDVATAVKFGRMLSAIGYKVTLCPYTNQAFWQSVYNQLGTNIVDGVYLQCYAGGAWNDPATWNGYFPGTKVTPGLWCRHDGGTAGSSASQVQAQMTAWRSSAGISGGFMWLYDDMLSYSSGDSPAAYAMAINTAVHPITPPTLTYNRVPYKESFENYELGSTMIGVKGWYGAAEAALVETNRYAPAVTGGYPLAGPHTQSLSFSGSVSNLFGETSALTNVCVDLLMTFQPDAGSPPVMPSGAQIAFWVNSSRRLMVWHGQAGSSNRWTELPDVTVSADAFVRLTVMADYARDPQGSFGYRLWVNRVPVTRPTDWFATACVDRNCLSRLALAGTGQVDDLAVEPYNTMLYRRITAAAGPHGRVAPAGDLLVPVGATTNIAIVPNPFYAVGAVTVDGLATGPVTGYTFANVADDHALSAGFAARLTSSGVPEFWLNGLNPAWKDDFEAHALADSDSDGVPNGQEYVAGTDATNRLSVFSLEFGASNGLFAVSFPTVPEGGFYGLGGPRRYALEQADDLAAGDWQAVPGLGAVAGAGQSVSYTNRLDASGSRFFRGRVWLEP